MREPPTPAAASIAPQRGHELRREDVLTAAARIRGHVRRTPLLELAPRPGLLLKAEHRQRGGSFKIRGAANSLLGRPTSGVVAGSSGNHGIAVATLGCSLGLRVTIVMTAASSELKQAQLASLGATVVLVDGGVTDRDRHAADYAERTGALLVPSSDDQLVIAGQGTVGLEVLADIPDIEAIFVPTGGGGLLAGVCLAARDSLVRVIGVEPEQARRYARSVAAGRPVSLPPPDTIADGLRAQRPGLLTLPIIQRRVDDLVGVSDDAIRDAQQLLHRSGVAAEPSGSVAVAAAVAAGSRYRRTVAVVSGGNGVAAAGPTDQALAQ
jgi:threo-3-hydroxy-L-aspartate ammonia-lyase